MPQCTPSRRSIDPVAPDPGLVRAAVDLMVAGKLVAYPTDTLYGLAADPRDAFAVEHLFDVKGRGREVAIPLIAADLVQVDVVGTLTETGRRLARAFWPGPLTVVIEAVPGLSRRLLGGGDSVAIRVPDHAVARLLASVLGHALTATSANRSGAPAPASADDVVATLGADVALVLDGGVLEGGLPSTIVDVRGTRPVLLREGRLAWNRVLQSLP